MTGSTISLAACGPRVGRQWGVEYRVREAGLPFPQETVLGAPGWGHDVSSSWARLAESHCKLSLYPQDTDGSDFNRFYEYFIREGLARCVNQSQPGSKQSPSHWLGIGRDKGQC